MSDQNNPKRICPLCQRKLKEDPEYPECFECPTKITYADVYSDCTPIPHYEWRYGQQTWYVGPYKLEQDETGLSIDKFEANTFKADYPRKPYFQYVMFLEQRIEVDDSKKALNKIKTIITFSWKVTSWTAYTVTETSPMALRKLSTTANGIKTGMSSSAGITPSTQPYT